MEAYFNGIKFTDADVVNYDDWIPTPTSKGRSYNPHNVRPFLLHDAGFVLAVVFADCLQDAIDEAVDSGKLNCMMIAHPGNTPGTVVGNAEFNDYVHAPTADDISQGNVWEFNGRQMAWNESVSFLGNASEPFDIESLGVEELPNPPASWCAVFAAAFPRKD